MLVTPKSWNYQSAVERGFHDLSGVPVACTNSKGADPIGREDGTLS